MNFEYKQKFMFLREIMEEKLKQKIEEQNTVLNKKQSDIDSLENKLRYQQEQELKQ